MTLASALIKQIISQGDFVTWNRLKSHYLPSTTYQKIHGIIDKHVLKYHKLPTFEDLKSSIRSRELQEQIYAIETVDTDIDPYLLLDYLKNEFAQGEILTRIDDYIENTITLADAQENIDSLQELVVQVQDRVDTKDDDEAMDTVELFDSSEDLENRLALGLNQDYDLSYKFSPKDLVVVGAQRGGGKSFTLCNIARAVQETGKSALYFTIEMDTRQILQRIVSMSTNVPLGRLIERNLYDDEWNKVAKWWAARFDKGQEHYESYLKDKDFDKFHRLLTREQFNRTNQIDVVYDPALTVAKIISTVRQKRAEYDDLGIIVVDYLNQVKRHNAPSRSGQYDWTEQIEISKALKYLAQDENVLVATAVQTNENNQVRFSRGIFDAVDAAYQISHWGDQENAIKLSCEKMRNGKMQGFVSEINWETLKIGPHTVMDPDEKQELKETFDTNEGVHDL